MNSGGFTEELYTLLTGKTEYLTTKETEQERATSDAKDKAAAQDEIVEKAKKLLSDVKSAAKSTYGNDKRKLSLFKIGESLPKAVKALIPLCNYYNELVADCKADLLKYGLIQSKIDELAVMAAHVTEADAEQESSLKIRKTKTMERDDAADELKEALSRIRNFAKVCFRDKPEILEQFKPIPKGRGGAGEEETPATPATPDK
jgi:phage-related minor tail protein